jgi:predicted DCC family thiol-disulfide oxidoreductase YuxK
MLDPGARANGWTGGQWSLVRAALALLVLLTGLVGLTFDCWADVFAGGEPPGSAATHGLRIALSLVLGLGLRDRVAAALLASTVVLGSSIGGSGEARLGAGWCALAELGIPWMLAFAALWMTAPPSPYGSWDARGRVDPGGGWRRAAWHVELGWVLFALACLARAATWLAEPAWPMQRLFALGLLAPIAGLLVPRLRPLGWSIALAATLAHVAFRLDASLDPIDPFPWLRIVLALLAFDPAWIPPRAARGLDHVFYDGTCGLCHRTLRFLIAEQRDPDAFRYAPLGGSTIARLVPASKRAGIPDSMVVLTADGRLLVRSRAALYLLERLGGLWRAAGTSLCVVPRPLADLGYDAVARARRLLFRRPADVCPRLPPELGARFLA